MDTPVTHLFVYASLRQGFENPFFEYIKNHFEFVGSGYVHGVLYDLGDYPVGVPHPDYRIIGELYQAKSPEDFDWSIAQLDDYEGMNPEEGQCAPYDRMIDTVYCNGNQYPAWIYWYTGDINSNIIVESGDVFEYMRRKHG
ncbi:MAG: gamma-glutamylcyclotransferase [Bacteroidota bacterium]|jgi:gamma-glutamylcyclotransferase (GGCT)/AIG2-like uncharacterized protein YtfP